eukprot:15366073-Ditylum_brightwellii.AAC.2
MAALEHRVLVTHLVYKAQTYMLRSEQDKLHIGCFQRTGCLITKSVDETKDKLSKHQGMTKPFKIPGSQIGNFQQSLKANDLDHGDFSDNDDGDDEETDVLLGDEF